MLFSVQEINWHTAEDSDWALSCDFKTEHFEAKKVLAEKCGSACTHFAWTPDNEGGTCWMKSGAAKKEDAHPTENDSMVCGIVKLSNISNSCF